MAQRLVLCASARIQGNHGYARSPRTEGDENARWTVVESEGGIRLEGDLGGAAKTNAGFDAQALSSDLAAAHQRLNGARKSIQALELHEQQEPRPNAARDARLMELRLSASTIQEEIDGLAAKVKAAQDLAAADSCVSFEFPVRLWEDEAWA